MWLLIVDSNMIVFTCLGTTLTGLVEGLLSCSVSHMTFGHKFGIILGTTSCIMVIQYCIGALVCVISSRGDGPDLVL